MNIEQWITFIEATALLVAADHSLRFTPFKECVQKIRIIDQSDNNESLDLSARQRQLIALVATAISRASKNMPWKVVCLPQAIAAKRMLNRRHIASTLYLGITRSSLLNSGERLSNSDLKNELIAHAWLKSGDLFITGRAGHEQYTVIGRFQ